jgi:hypothetical protein
MGGDGGSVPRLIVNLITEAGGIDNGQGDAGALLIQFQLCHPQVSIGPGCETRIHSPTVTGLMRTPSSMWAWSGSSASLLSRTCLPQRVLTKVVRPRGWLCQQQLAA